MLFLEQVFAALRPPAPAQPPAAIGAPVIEPVVGRYLRLDFNGRPHRLYFEEAGQGIPLLCLHTAGADGRQYRDVLNDPAITARFRVIAFDLPWHGKSSPPAGFETEAYQLTTELYVDTVMAVSRALGLERPVVMGCSIGGRAVLHLALRHGAHFRAAIGLQSATHAERRRRHPTARSRRAVPARHPWPGGGGRHGRLPDRADLARAPTSGRPCGTTCRAGRACSWATCTTISATAISGSRLAGLDRQMPALPADRRIRPLGDAGAHRRARTRDGRAALRGHEGHGPLPDVGEPREFRRYLMPVLDRIAPDG